VTILLIGSLFHDISWGHGSTSFEVSKVRLYHGLDIPMAIILLPVEGGDVIAEAVEDMLGILVSGSVSQLIAGHHVADL
jgi:hypothetical protein